MEWSSDALQWLGHPPLPICPFNICLVNNQLISYTTRCDINAVQCKAEQASFFLKEHCDAACSWTVWNDLLPESNPYDGWNSLILSTGMFHCFVNRSIGEEQNWAVASLVSRLPGVWSYAQEHRVWCSWQLRILAFSCSLALIFTSINYFGTRGHAGWECALISQTMLPGWFYVSKLYCIHKKYIYKIDVFFTFGALSQIIKSMCSMCRSPISFMRLPCTAHPSSVCEAITEDTATQCQVGAGP